MVTVTISSKEGKQILLLWQLTVLFCKEIQCCMSLFQGLYLNVWDNFIFKNGAGREEKNPNVLLHTKLHINYRLQVSKKL